MYSHTWLALEATQLLDNIGDLNLCMANFIFPFHREAISFSDTADGKGC